MTEKAKEIIRRLVYNKETGEIHLSRVFELIRPPPDKKDKKEKP